MKTVRVAAAIIEENGKIFATQRGYGEFKDGWEFPGGKIEPGETPEEAIVREIQEELDTEIEVLELLDTVEYDYPAFHLSMDCFLCRIISGNLVLKEHEAAAWVEKKDLYRLDWLPADLGLVEKLTGISEKNISFFPIHQVRLKEGTVFYEKQKLMTEYLLSIDDDQMLYNFRKASGLDTGKAQPMTGWDEETGKLRGHTTGHYLSALALAFAATGKTEFKKKIDYMVEELWKCQKAFAASGDYHRGFLSAYSEEQFDLLEKFTKYPEIWAPYYTLDKIMSGLYDCFMLAGNKKILEILDPLGDWVYDRLSRLSKETRNQMWSMYIAGEFGAMIGTMVKLYDLTGKENHLKAARLFENEKLFVPMQENRDVLEDMHANQHIPQMNGALELYRATGDKAYWDMARNFWQIVTGGHAYCIGGVGEAEMFHRANSISSYLTEKAAESCASYNMLRLTAHLFAYTPHGGMMDYYENTLRNHIMASASHTGDGGTTYFMPLCPGGRKEYSTTENSCCHGTGMESRFRYMEHIYARDEKAVYVNLLIDSVLYDEAGEKLLEQTGSEAGKKVEIICHQSLKQNLNIHIPAWAEKEYRLTVNGAAENIEVVDGYAVLPGSLKAGTRIRLELPMKLRLLDVKSDPALVNLAYGPYILAAVSEEKDFLQAPAETELHQTDGKPEFEAGGVRMLPISRIDQDAYHVYFKK